MDSPVANKVCPLCRYEAPTVPAVLSHLRTIHFSDPNFLVACGINGCANTSKSFSALYSHIYRHHPEFIKNRKKPVDSCIIYNNAAREINGRESNDGTTEVSFSGTCSHDTTLLIRNLATLIIEYIASL